MEPITITLNITNTEDNFKKIARFRGYSDEVVKSSDEMPPRFDENGELVPYSIEEMRKPNPQTEVEWLTEHIKNVLAGFASEPFVLEARKEAESIIAAREEEVLALARESIS